ncbi:hypothetical protein COEREDRAFT_84873 [Coemansia reversa NRRL 1564]|uniref:Uncharacterized protein n=1 Tax=Coemansia reversa (strain ATCC 12441 / NRRL 1564) TaxID=763665 RepID=A0A2G5BIS2_COERN|nr:hypothetical protein COEREDRAFT_84873 [Coemansia reversa NRRL 1564]|eukprot:PIA18934.1 hypothetical protein COEREDRAFT_84873 [Coemansia reversa NRRL 1564]
MAYAVFLSFSLRLLAVRLIPFSWNSVTPPHALLFLYTFPLSPHRWYKLSTSKMLRRLLLPTPSRLLGCVRLERGVLIAATFLIIWHAVAGVVSMRSAWALYDVWMVVSACAGIYAQRTRDVGHAQWFGLALFVDFGVYIVGVAYSRELVMGDAEQCALAMDANRSLTLDQCLAHVHEIRAIAWVLRAAVALLKIHIASLTYAFELELSANH